MQGDIYPMAIRNDTNPTVVCEMLRAVNKWKTREVYSYFNKLQRTVKELSMQWCSGLLHVTLYIFDSFATVVLEAQWSQKG